MPAFLVFPFLLVAILCGSLAVPGGVVAQEKVIGRFITGIRDRNFQYVVDTVEIYQTSIKSIKGSNPQVLWDKLIKEVYGQAKQDFEQIMAAGRSTGGSPVGDFRMFALPTIRWQILEQRLAGELTLAYVKLLYPDPASSPLLEGNLLKETIFEFYLTRHSGLISSVNRFQRGDVRWPDSLEAAESLYQRQVYVPAKDMLERLMRSGQDTQKIRNLLARSYLVVAQFPYLVDYANIGLMGVSYYEVQFKSARQLITAAMSLDSVSMQSWVGIAEQISTRHLGYGRTKNSDAAYLLAAKILEDCLEVIGEHKQLRGLLINISLERGLEKYRQGSGPAWHASYGASFWLESLLKLDPSNSEAANALGQIYLDAYKTWPFPKNALNALKFDPSLRNEICKVRPIHPREVSEICR